jgi:hypothetical protein
MRQNFGGAWRAVSPAAKSRQRMVYPGQEAANWRHPANISQRNRLGTLQGLLNVSAE